MDPTQRYVKVTMALSWALHLLPLCPHLWTFPSTPTSSSLPLGRPRTVRRHCFFHRTMSSNNQQQSGLQGNYLAILHSFSISINFVHLLHRSTGLGSSCLDFKVQTDFILVAGCCILFCRQLLGFDQQLLNKRKITNF